VEELHEETPTAARKMIAMDSLLVYPWYVEQEFKSGNPINFGNNAM